MTLQISLPLGSRETVKNVVFTILTREYPLKLIELTNFIRKRYGKAVTFQAVRKAVIELMAEGVLIKQGTSYSINKVWIQQAKKTIDNLYEEIYSEKEKPKKFDSIGEDLSVFTFDSVGSMMKFWENIIDTWHNRYRDGEYNLNCYQAAHLWEPLLYPETEQKIMSQLKKKGIRSYVLSTGRSPLDKASVAFYKKIGIKMRINPSSTSFDKEYSVGTYGDLVVQTRYPGEIVSLLDSFFKNNKNLSKLDIQELTNIINKKVEIKLTVTKNINMAKQINKSIISQIE